jgi:hypothetical protein
MFALQVRKKKITDTLKRVHAARVRQWRSEGSIGLKPKLYRTVEDVFVHGLQHPDISNLLQDAPSTVSKSTR